MPDTFKILIVDDESKLVDRLTTFLKNEGYLVDGATTFEDAEKLLEITDYRLIITDLRLSKDESKDGLSLIHLAKELNPSCNSILISAYSSLETGVKALDAGAIEVLTKPVRLPRLLEIVTRLEQATALRRRVTPSASATPRPGR